VPRSSRLRQVVVGFLVVAQPGARSRKDAFVQDAGVAGRADITADGQRPAKVIVADQTADPAWRARCTAHPPARAWEIAMPDTLTVIDNRTGKQYEVPSRTAPSAPWTCARSRRARRLRPDDLRPGVPEHRVVPKRDHLHRRRPGHPRVPGLPDRAGGRAQQLPRDSLPALFGELPTRAQAQAWTARIRSAPCFTQNVKKFIEGFR